MKVILDGKDVQSECEKLITNLPRARWFEEGFLALAAQEEGKEDGRKDLILYDDNGDIIGWRCWNKD